MLQYSWTCDRAIFGDMPYDKDRDMQTLGDSHEFESDGAYLCHGAWGGGCLLRVKCLNRVNDDKIITFTADFRDDGTEIDLREEIEFFMVGIQSVGAELDLAGRLFS